VLYNFGIQSLVGFYLNFWRSSRSNIVKRNKTSDVASAPRSRAPAACRPAPTCPAAWRPGPSRRPSPGQTAPRGRTRPEHLGSPRPSRVAPRVRAPACMPAHVRSPLALPFTSQRRREASIKGHRSALSHAPAVFPCARRCYCHESRRAELHSPLPPVAGRHFHHLG
jgi:hypothetical protein